MAELIGVLIVSEIELLREGLEMLLGRDERITIEDGDPDVVLLDTAIGDGPAAVREAAARLPRARVVALGVSETTDELLPLAEAGIAGFVTRGATHEEVADAVWHAAHDELDCSPQVASTLLRHVRFLAARRRGDAAAAALTRREREIAGLIDEGLSNKQIASRLCIELPTVKNHVHNILEKLHVSRRGEAVARLRETRRVAGI
jgi:two-component system, NarL family, nitrate/nitrite response regulator NarL